MSFPMGGDWMNYFRTAILICHAKWASTVSGHAGEIRDRVVTGDEQSLY
jgi:hypothetical protein